MSRPQYEFYSVARFPLVLICATACFMLAQESSWGAQWDTEPDTWVATDGLGRTVPLSPEVPLPRANRTVGMFYFLWHGAHVQGGPFDVSRILAQDPEAMRKPESPLWGPLHVPHHWGESLFGYYLTADEGVLRKHAQMLSDAGVDVVIFDVTNQITYRDDYRALLKVWSEMRRLGNRTPQVAFLTPFWDPAKVTRELWHDLYSPGLHPDLWFRWEGKPLILADPDLLFEGEQNAHQSQPVELQPGRTLGQSFTSSRRIKSVGGRFPTWSHAGSAVTLTLFRGGPGGERLAADRFHNVHDNAWLRLELNSPLPPGQYYLEASEPGGTIGWWSHPADQWPGGEAFDNGRAAGGDRTLRLQYSDGETQEIRDFFTFRKPQPDYFQGPTQSNMWSWLEVYPQHVFTNAAGNKEQMSVGVGQNAVGGRLGSMSEPGALGRSYHGGALDTRPEAVRHGFNVAEQWERALKQDPQFVFVTGWNEWIAGRFAEFNRVKMPVMFVDQFDQEHSRDIEPMRGGHGDDYYYQFVSHVRRYKGARAPQTLVSKPIQVDGHFEDWAGVAPEYRDTLGDPVHRDHRGWDTQIRYTNHTGSNDLVAAKVSWDATTAWFYIRTREPIPPLTATETNAMLLFLDLDSDPKTGWLGYDYVIGHSGAGAIERNRGGRFDWASVGRVQFKVSGNEMEISVPWSQLGLKGPPRSLDFKWADHCIVKADWSDFTLNGDAAPNDRFNYRVIRP